VREGKNDLFCSTCVCVCVCLRVAQDARWRRGETVSQQTARDQMISLEAVASSQLAFSRRGN
jgi:hypothetical protein